MGNGMACGSGWTTFLWAVAVGPLSQGGFGKGVSFGFHSYPLIV